MKSIAETTRTLRRLRDMLVMAEDLVRESAEESAGWRGAMINLRHAASAARLVMLSERRAGIARVVAREAAQRSRVRAP